MSLAASYCEDCGKRFTVEVYLPSDMKISYRDKMLAPRGPLKDWAEWALHCMCLCPDCRFEFPPTQCIADLQNWMKKRREETSE